MRACGHAYACKGASPSSVVRELEREREREKECEREREREREICRI